MTKPGTRARSHTKCVTSTTWIEGSRAMVRLVYTCPKTGVVILGGVISERTVIRAYHEVALVNCPACDDYHHPRVSECKMFGVDSEHKAPHRSQRGKFSVPG